MSDELRIGDAERERAAADLGEHFAQGRLTVDEHSERLDQVMRARTYAELTPVFSDLPDGAYGVRPAAMPSYSGGDTGGAWRPGRSGRPGRMPAPLFVLLAIAVAVAVLTHLPIVLGGLFVWLVFFKHRRWHHGR